MSDLVELSELRVRRERWIDAPPQTVYDLISDVEASAAWTPDLVSATYETEGAPRAGLWVTAVNADVRHSRMWPGAGAVSADYVGVAPSRRSKASFASRSTAVASWPPRRHAAW
ncbi:SRPBCC family protein [Streptomyces sp. NPDC048410]|uniref:SRPBCC family protein n=1 Tax=Streptomyces sp. NPDC048410 TaxID=3365545 RepID=UPI0037188165